VSSYAWIRGNPDYLPHRATPCQGESRPEIRRSVVRRTLLIVNVLVALATLASALAVLVSDVVDPGYRAHYRDALWFVAVYVAVQVVMVVAFARDGPLVPWLACAKAAVAALFLASFTSLWPYWAVWTPARYVYQVFEWNGEPTIALFAMIFLGRGAFNVANAMFFTAPWWRSLRVRRPLVGRLVTAVPIGGVAVCVWLFLQLSGEEKRTFSADATEVARLVLDGVDCDAVRAHAGKTTTDVRQRGDRRYEVAIAYTCPIVRVVVRAEDGRVGTAAMPRPDCCTEAP
jgi:hypothetical protein